MTLNLNFEREGTAVEAGQKKKKRSSSTSRSRGPSCRALPSFPPSQSARIQLPPFQLRPGSLLLFHYRHFNSYLGVCPYNPNRLCAVPVLCWAPLQVIAFANWENRTAGTIASRVGKERLKDLQGADAEALLARRHRVADLYNREMEQWEHEVSSRVVLIRA